MKKKFEYDLFIGTKSLPKGEEGDAYDARVAAYFKRLARRNISPERWKAKEARIRSKCRDVIDAWRKGDIAEEAFKDYMRDAIDYFNEFNYYRFKNDLPDYMPLGTLRLLYLMATLDDIKPFSEKQKELWCAATYLYMHIQNEQMFMNGIYISGFEI
ncbi:MAG: hypothetical protein J6Y74_00250 [Clostridia bacterium]|nr:hypothetical protein [Clostridia bacterium]